MFYGGVIISTRKLVYRRGRRRGRDQGPDAVPAQIVLRDLKRGVFDDKIDQYLVGTEGLLPRGSSGREDGERPAAAGASTPEPMIPIPICRAPASPRCRSG